MSVRRKSKRKSRKSKGNQVRKSKAKSDFIKYLVELKDKETQQTKI